MNRTVLALGFSLLCSTGIRASAQTGASVVPPTFTTPVPLVQWLLAHSGHGFSPIQDATTANVFSPGLRAAIRTSMNVSKQRDEPPCGANGDFIRDTQEDGFPSNVSLVPKPTAPDRITVAATFDVDGYHRAMQFMTVNLDGVWKLENIMNGGKSLRRLLLCQ